MKLTMLGTGNASVTECYNTCFLLSENGEHFLVDGGGGSELLSRLKSAQVDWKDVRDIFVTHKHIDHLLGIIWMIRMICQGMSRNSYEGEARIYAHGELCELLKSFAGMLFKEKETRFIGTRLHIIALEDGEEKTIIGRKVRFFDIESNKAKQFGFCMWLSNGERLCCCGDEPYKDCEKEYAGGARWLMHEAFCLHSQAELFKPYEKDHSTVMDACALAERLKVKNLILYHTEDKNIARRKELYSNEGAEYFGGGLYVPYDLETIELN